MKDVVIHLFILIIMCNYDIVCVYVPVILFVSTWKYMCIAH